MKHIRLLPVLIMVSALTFTIRLGDFITGLSRSGSAYAQAEVKASPPPLPAVPDGNAPKDGGAPAPGSDPAHAADASAPPLPSLPVPASTDKAPADKAAPPADKTAADKPADTKADADKKPANWKDAGDAEVEDSAVKAGLYKDLAKRAADLDKREKDLKTREALLKAGEQEVDQKLQQLTSIRNEIQGLMKTQSDEEKARIESLVKIYEGMKPEDAARIFNTLDMDVVMKVMSTMSERKSGPILAAMSPERARTVTQQLAQQKQLPEIPPQ